LSTEDTSQTVPLELQQFLSCIFEPDDNVLIRPVETWIDRDRKRSRVVFKEIRHRLVRHLLSKAPIWYLLIRMAERERANLFFGVCPRGSGKGSFDRAFHIRVVRVLWADLDHCTAEEAQQRCEAASLPRATVVIQSGHGIHLYWRLTEPLLIDDAGDPLPVHKEFIEQGEGKKKKVRSYVEVHGERIYEFLPDSRGRDSHSKNPLFPRLSPKALRVQDILYGIAAKIRGDHTFDLARILRLPATLNRKNQRNGQEPTPCTLLECHPERRYPITLFEPLAQDSPTKVERDKVAQVRLPPPRNLTTPRLHKLTDYINRCAAAEVGQRSGADFRLCCHAIGNGYDKEEIWNQVSNVGKFAERGRDYFDLTWANAEDDVRTSIYRRCAKRSTKPQANTSCGETASCTNGDASLADGVPREEQPDEAEDDPHRLARLFKDDYIALVYWQAEWYWWDGLAYRRLSPEELRARLCARIKKEFDRLAALAVARWEDNQGCDDAGNPIPKPVARKVSTKLVNDAVQALGGLAILDFSINPPSWLGEGHPPLEPVDLITCKNGLLHVPSVFTDGTDLFPHTPAFFSMNALDYNFEGPAAPTQWLAFLRKTWPDDQQSIDTVQEWFGYCLTPDTSQQKILMIVGPKRSGKGTIARVQRALIGINNTASPTLASLGTNFGLWPLMNKTLAIISDARLSGRTDVAQVTERLLSISGEDAQTIDRKYLTPATVKLLVRFMILTNELPRLSDPSGALVGRIVLIRQTLSWYGKEDRKLTSTLLAELPAILFWSLDGWARLNARGHFIQPESGAELITDLEDLTSPIGAFIREFCLVGPEYRTGIDDLYTLWTTWCETKGRKEHGTCQTFGRDLRAALPHIRVRQPRTGQVTRIRVYEGIRGKDVDELARDAQEG
jgi:putative DNA primase/helicase